MYNFPGLGFFLKKMGVGWVWDFEGGREWGEEEEEEGV